MKLEDLSAEDQALVKQEFPAELEKEAAEQVKLAQELFTTGFEKLAAETADELDKLAAEGEKEEEKEEKEEGKELNEEQKKEAAVRGAFIAQGFIDGLKKLGQERHGDEMAYLYPFINEKLANMGKVMDFTKRMGGKAMDAGKALAAKAKPMADKAMAAAKDQRVQAAAGGAVAGAAGLKGLQMMGRKKKD